VWQGEGVEAGVSALNLNIYYLTFFLREYQQSQLSFLCS
jgi:hypothetical protein